MTMPKKPDELTLQPITTAVTRLPSQPEELAPIDHGGDVLAGVNIGSLLERAVDSKAAVEVLERLQVLRKELRVEKAKEAYDEAMAAFQAACPVIDKTKFGAKDAYKYAPLDVIVVVVRGLLQTHGFSYSVTSEIEANWVKAICRVTHRGGHSEESAFKVPIDSRNPMMNDPQRYAGSMTFAKRYAFCNAFGILTADEDKDGSTRRQKPAGPSNKAADDVSARPLAVELWKLLNAKCGEQEKDWNSRNQWLWDNDILDGGAGEAAPHLSVERFKLAIAKTKETLR
jgi:hypothetical protein